MKPITVKDARICAVVTRNHVFLVLTDETGRSLTFEPPASPVTHAWSLEMRAKAGGKQLELPI